MAGLPGWVTPLLVAVGLASSLAETVGITLVLLFFYLAMGQMELATSTGGVLGDALRYAALWFHGSVVTAAAVLVLILARGALAFAHSLISARIGEQINEFSRNSVHHQYLSASYRFFQKHEEAYLLDVLGTETWLISGAYSSFNRIIVSTCSIVLFASFLMALSVKITVTAVIASWLVSLGLRRLTGPVRILGADVKRVHQELAEHMLMTLQAMRTIRAYGQEDVHHKRFVRASADARRISLSLTKLSALVSPLTEVGYLLILGFIILLANLWGIGFATTLTAVALLYRLQPHIRELEGSLLHLAQIEPQLRSLRLMLSSEGKEYPALGHSRLGALHEGVFFKEVTFRYSPEGGKALDRVTFQIPAGKTTVLFGASGSGKTTIVNLLLRLYGADEGVIRIDGQSLEDVRRVEWLGQLAIAGQDVDLIEGTIIDNVRMANESASQEKVVEALSIAGISEFIESLPEEYDTWVGQQGLRFSGGQRQRIALARAVLRDPQFLILDEAMSALDGDLEESVRRAIQARFSDRTILLITHRLETVFHADHVIRIEAGKIRAEGLPTELFKDPGQMLRGRKFEGRLDI
ncbi:ABC transporter ATP-binding protein [Bradyrhizobium sp. CCBAU 11386]|uniref:ABC transporter ATP-binding protein n=1 Tax=Bradyrhizobium sp. CCBAU 11386 TaxID=1630837 RepID=UPI0023020A9F|nr:ABC transporter ATP-binding protein [Bradyrhizobium sp. CCBAU 11386]